jgi:hypothetical protein
MCYGCCSEQLDQLVCDRSAASREIDVLSHCTWGHIESSGSGQALAYGLHPAGVTFKPYNSKHA